MKNLIIVVDDTDVVLHCLKDHLEQKGYSRVETFSHPREAYDYIEKNGCPAFIVADFDMPDMTGIELLYAVAKLYPTVEGVIVTGNPSRLPGTTKYPVIPKNTIEFFDRVVDHVGSRVAPE